MSATVPQLIKEVLLYLPKAKIVWSTNLLHTILTKGRGSRNTRLAYSRRRVKNFEKDMKTFYEDTNYHCMEKDVHRNKYFAHAIQNATKQGLLQWVEVGPGALGTLTRMILEADNRTQVVAIEIVDSSVQLLNKKLRKWLQVHRASIVEGLAGKVTLEGVECDVLIGEVLGHIASNEGWTATLHALGKQNPQWKCSIKQVIPAHYGTKLVPVDLSSVNSLDSDLVIGSRLAFIPSLPFNQAQLTLQHGFLEKYNAIEEFIQGSGRDPRCQEASFPVNESRPFHGLALYVVYGSDDKNWQHSNRDLPDASTNWYNVFIPVCKGKFVCLPGDNIVVHTKVWVDTHHPRYEIITHVLRDGHIVLDDTSTFDYYDLICTRCPIHGWEPY
jgi:hypothetical protein